MARAGAWARLALGSAVAPPLPAIAALASLAPVASLASLAFLGCAGEPPKAPHAMVPIAEDRAAQVIARAFRDEGLTPEAGRDVHLSRDVTIRMDVAAAGHRFGVAYVTAADAQRLGDAIPRRPEGSDALVVLTGEQGARILVLYEADYVEDDAEGEAHTATTIAAERKLDRDARDFVYRAKNQGWP